MGTFLRLEPKKRPSKKPETRKNPIATKIGRCLSRTIATAMMEVVTISTPLRSPTVSAAKRDGEEHLRDSTTVCVRKVGIRTESDGCTIIVRLVCYNKRHKRPTESDSTNHDHHVDDRRVDLSSDNVVGVDNLDGGHGVETSELLHEGEGGGDHS
jgi:hypothetical protein